MATLMDGKLLSKLFLEKIRQELIHFKANNNNFQVGLAIIQVFNLKFKTKYKIQTFLILYFYFYP